MYVAKKPCNFAGKKFAIGEEIPEELIDPNRFEKLVKFGRIEKVEEKQPDTGDTKPESKSAPENVHDGANKPESTENEEKLKSKPEDGKNAVKTPLNATRKPANKAANAKTKQKGGK